MSPSPVVPSLTPTSFPSSSHSQSCQVYSVVSVPGSARHRTLLPPPLPWDTRVWPFHLTCLALLAPTSQDHALDQGHHSPFARFMVTVQKIPQPQIRPVNMKVPQLSCLNVLIRVSVLTCPAFQEALGNFPHRSPPAATSKCLLCPQSSNTILLPPVSRHHHRLLHREEKPRTSPSSFCRQTPTPLASPSSPPPPPAAKASGTPPPASSHESPLPPQGP